MSMARSRITAAFPAVLCVGVLAWYVWFIYFSGAALFMAATRGNAAEVKNVLAHGVPVDVRDSWGKSTAVILASSTGGPNAVEIIRTLLDNGADVNAKNTFGNTALMLAAEKKRTDVVRLLLRRGADVHTTNKRGRTALSMATRQGHAGIIALLKAAGAKQ